MKLTIYIEPTPKARPRVVRKGSRVMSYTPSRTAHAEAVIRTQIAESGVFFNRDTAVRLAATFYRRRPKSAPKKVRLPITRPDCLNYSQLLQDALQGYLFADDAQITTLVLRRVFGRLLRIEIEVTEDKRTPGYGEQEKGRKITEGKET